MGESSWIPKVPNHTGITLLHPRNLCCVVSSWLQNWHVRSTIMPLVQRFLPTLMVFKWSVHIKVLIFEWNLRSTLPIRSLLMVLMLLRWSYSYVFPLSLMIGQSYWELDVICMWPNQLVASSCARYWNCHDCLYFWGRDNVPNQSRFHWLVTVSMSWATLIGVGEVMSIEHVAYTSVGQVAMHHRTHWPFLQCRLSTTPRLQWCHAPLVC